MVLDSYATSKMSEHSQGPPNMVFKTTEFREQRIWRNMLFLNRFRQLFMLGKLRCMDGGIDYMICDSAWEGGKPDIRLEVQN
ncbi:hypothetical protein L5515_018892 [Caenorhabditis briggsae]|uniref:Uncharacterized protein n=1 Tax=Caenorhabditis briggsae TaxID=6238 RepID=A0AAE9FDE0_CAEBR|nr:hypothetical protein L5515_018892 [Caenorhabditis briggsae]